MTPIGLITLTDPRSAAAEAYRGLRTNLMFTGVERAINTLVVTSAAQHDGKSLVIANLAVTLAQAGHATIVIDADLRRPSQHEIWGVANEAGLGAMMMDERALAAPPLTATDIPNLHILTSGTLPPVPADVLSSARMSEIIAALKTRAAYLLFDSPPALAATDAALLGAKLDAAIIAVRAGATRRDHTARARQALERVGVRIAGVVLTNAPRERGQAY